MHGRTDDLDLCNDCVYYAEYGRLPDDRTTIESTAHGLVFRERLARYSMFSSGHDEGGFSWSYCDGCGATGLHLQDVKAVYHARN